MVTARIKRLLRMERPSRAVPDGVRVYAVGDIHGRLDLFDALVERIGRDRAGWSGEAEVVLLGDYIDRGPQSAELLDRLAGALPDWARWTVLRGNHEQAMLDAADGGPEARRVLRAWLDNGGRETLRSYGMSAIMAFSDDLDAIEAELRVRVPARHLNFLRRLKLTRRIGDYLFVHAGIRPGVALDAQAERDLLWIRDEFLDCREDHGCVVVHGHSITPTVTERDNRIGIDTGAYATGRLTALVLEGEGRRYLST
jgi:serine/threonine protein phosphatase 1